MHDGMPTSTMEAPDELQRAYRFARSIHANTAASPLDSSPTEENGRRQVRHRYAIRLCPAPAK